MSDLVIALSVLFITAGAFLVVANHLSLSPIPFYILAGIVAGVFVGEPELIELAQWGIAFLVFVFGVRLQPTAVREVLRDGEFAAGLHVVVLGPLAFALGLALGFDVENAVFVAVAVTLSSTIVGVSALQVELRENRVHARLAQSIHLFQDVLAIGIILVLSAESFTALEVTSSIGYGALFLLAAVVVSRYAYPLLRRVTAGSSELLLMGTISILIGFIAAAELANLSIVIGAFAAGIAVPGDATESLEMLNGVQSIRDFFVAIFFVTVGALVSIEGIVGLDLAMLGTAALLVGAVAVIKPLLTILAFIYEGYDTRTSFLAGRSLNHVSEFTLIIAIEAAIAGTIVPELFDAIILAAAVTMILSAAASDRGWRLVQRTLEHRYRTTAGAKTGRRSSVPPELSGHVIVIGFGRQGRRIVEQCRNLEVPVLVIENDPLLWAPIRRECRSYILGDAVTESTWQRAKVEEAELVISTVDQDEVAQFLVTADADTPVVVRADSRTAALEFLEGGAAYAIVPDILASDHLVGIVEELLTGDLDEEELRLQHLERLAIMDRGAFDRRHVSPEGVIEISGR